MSSFVQWKGLEATFHQQPKQVIEIKSTTAAQP